jgi:hypothetical protein
MTQSNSKRGARSALAVVVGVAAILVIVAGTAIGRGSVSPSPTPSSGPTASPSGAPTPSPTPSPTDVPSDDPAEEAIDLENVLGDDVSVVIKDDTGTLVEAESGTPGDGMSVRWFDVKVENIDAETLRVVWVGLPGDQELDLLISENDGAYRLRFVQPAPPANSDALGHDRVLVLRFAEPVSAADVQATIEESVDAAD